MKLWEHSFNSESWRLISQLSHDHGRIERSRDKIYKVSDLSIENGTFDLFWEEITNRTPFTIEYGTYYRNISEILSVRYDETSNWSEIEQVTSTEKILDDVHAGWLAGEMILILVIHVTGFGIIRLEKRHKGAKSR